MTLKTFFVFCLTIWLHAASTFELQTALEGDAHQKSVAYVGLVGKLNGIVSIDSEEALGLLTAKPESDRNKFCQIALSLAFHGPSTENARIKEIVLLAASVESAEKQRLRNTKFYKSTILAPLPIAPEPEAILLPAADDEACDACTI